MLQNDIRRADAVRHMSVERWHPDGGSRGQPRTPSAEPGWPAQTQGRLSPAAGTELAGRRRPGRSARGVAGKRHGTGSPPSSRWIWTSWPASSTSPRIRRSDSGSSGMAGASGARSQAECDPGNHEPGFRRARAVETSGLAARRVSIVAW